MNHHKVTILGAGAAGLFLAGILTRNKIKCHIIEKNPTPGKKILISGGGRCNFTNLNIEKHHFEGTSKNFHWSILQDYTNENFINLVKKHAKPNAQNPQGGIIEKEAPIHISNLSLLTEAGQATRVGYRMEEGKKVRYAKKSNEVI